MGCDLVFTQRREGRKKVWEMARMKAARSMKQIERETKTERHIRIHFNICSLFVSTS